VRSSTRQWRAAAGPVVYDSIWDGETYDARKELRDPAGHDWSAAAYDDSGWGSPLLATSLPPTVVLSSPLSPPIRRFEGRAPVSLTEHKPGVWLADFGQNMAAVVQLRLAPGRRGTRVQLRHAEVLLHEPFCGGAPPWRDAGHAPDCDGGIYTANLRSARATDVYFMSGAPGGERYTPRFVAGRGRALPLGHVWHSSLSTT
jgi:alpha-L-rhamnosidase